MPFSDNLGSIFRTIFRDFVDGDSQEIVRIATCGRKVFHNVSRQASLFDLSNASSDVFPRIIEVTRVGTSFLFLVLFSPDLYYFKARSIGTNDLRIRISSTCHRAFCVRINPSNSIINVQGFCYL